MRLIEASELPTVTIQLLPFEAGAHGALAGCFQILEFSGGTDHSLVYSEGVTGGVFRSRPDELRSYFMRFEALRAMALNDHESAEFIESIARGKA
jgi:hypothetical protein